VTLEEAKAMLIGIVGSCGCGDGPKICAYDQAVRVLSEAVVFQRDRCVKVAEHEIELLENLIRSDLPYDRDVVDEKIATARNILKEIRP